ncbi:MAG: L-histidine N(alpha)-methyltransferase [Deltaproteobacteria bacterium]|nr:L-histidine N(alpha)-methyltransferase [Deltaproteobacteria bacterium]
MSDLDDAIRAGLRARPRRLPSALLYDALGSALFEAITFLPEYELARADVALLLEHADDVIAALPGLIEVVELGPGGGRKAAVFVEPLRHRQMVPFTAIDVSRAALESCTQALSVLPGVFVQPIEDTWIAGLRRAHRSPGHRRLVLFLGSSVSNLDRSEAARFFVDVAGQLRPGDALLVASDLVKPLAQLLPAYDDALGVCAAFNKNVLVRLNREWGADFPLDAFRHRARWNAHARRVELHLEALWPVTTSVLDLPVALDLGESLWTASSHRFSLDELHAWAEAAGFSVAEEWIYEPWAFAHSLFVVEPRVATFAHLADRDEAYAAEQASP